MSFNGIKTVGIIGTGLIGSSWTALFLSYGLKVLVADPAADAEQKLADYLQCIWPSVTRLGTTHDASLKNYRFVGATLDGHYEEVDFIQENAPERRDIKAKLIANIDAATRPEVIIASSSSGISSSQFIGECTKDAGRVLICHPFNPPHLMPLVEIVPHPETYKATIENAIQFYRHLGKRPVLLHREVPGFCANRLQAAIIKEAYSLVSRGIVTAEDLDICVTSSLGPRWAVTGPFLANAMGGGGGSEGFKHFLDHLGPAVQYWLNDMDAHTFEWKSEEKDALIASVDAELKGKDMSALESRRDESLINIIKSETKGHDL